MNLIKNMQTDNKKSKETVNVLLFLMLFFKINRIVVKNILNQSDISPIKVFLYH